MELMYTMKDPTMAAFSTHPLGVSLFQAAL